MDILEELEQITKDLQDPVIDSIERTDSITIRDIQNYINGYKQCAVNVIGMLDGIMCNHQHDFDKEN